MWYSRLHEIFYELLSHFELKYWREISVTSLPDVELYIPLYGHVKIEDPLPKVYFLPIVQRLSEIKQLTLTDSKYSGGSHTRLEHSVGVMRIAEEVLSQVQRASGSPGGGVDISKYVSNTNINKYTVIIKLGALLHDLGHGGWGHALDGLNGYVMELLAKSDPNVKLTESKKLDIAIAWYLLSNNDQLRGGMRGIAKSLKIDQEDLIKSVSLMIAEELNQIILEFINDRELQAITSLGQTILGEPEGVGGVNADRIDWIPRDALHLMGCSVRGSSERGWEDLLREKASQLLETFFNSLKGGCFIKIREETIRDNNRLPIVVLNNNNFINLIREVREEMYDKIYENELKALGDSLLLRLAFSAVSALEIVGEEVASPTLYSRVILSFILQPDRSLRENVRRVLSAAADTFMRIDIMNSRNYPLMRYIIRSAELVKLLDVLPSLIHTKRDHAGKEIPYPDKSKSLTLYTFNGEFLFESICDFRKIHSSEFSESWSFPSFITAVLEDMLMNPITKFNVPQHEDSLIQELGEGNRPMYILINHYFFKKISVMFNQYKNLLKKLEDECLKKEVKKEGDSSNRTKGGEEGNLSRMLESPFIWILVREGRPLDVNKLRESMKRVTTITLAKYLGVSLSPNGPASGS